MNYGKVEEPSSSRPRSPSTARYGVTSAILTATSSKSDRAPTSLTDNARPALKTETSEWARNGLHVDVASGGCPGIGLWEAGRSSADLPIFATPLRMLRFP